MASARRASWGEGIAPVWACQCPSFSSATANHGTSIAIFGWLVSARWASRVTSAGTIVPWG